MDHIIKYKEKLEKSLKMAKGTKNIVNLYCIGFENLSQKMLDLYNKGITVKDCIKAINIIRYLSKEFKSNYISKL